MAAATTAPVLTPEELEAKLSIMQPKEEERQKKLPFTEIKFYPSKVHKVIKELLEDRLKGVEYDPKSANQICERLIAELREKIKREVRIPRYKIGLQLVMGEIKGQGVRIASKCLWDAQNDNYSSYTFTNEKLYCTALVFGCYFE